MGLTEQLGHPDPREREAAARAVATAVWDPEAEGALAAALTAVACGEEDPAALEAQLHALPTVEAGLSDADLVRLGLIRSAAPVLGRLLSRAGRLQIAGPVEPSGPAARAVVRCLRGAPAVGAQLRTPEGAWAVLERIELYGRAVDRLDTGLTARVLLTGSGARGLGEWERLDVDPRAREDVRLLRAPDPESRRLGAQGASDWPRSWGPEDGRLLCGALVRAALAETDEVTLEAELHALIALGAFMDPDGPALTLLRTMDRAALPEVIRGYLDDLLEP
ncbi:hypothetical protein ACIOD1_00550 [Streptomyces sp. NPDC088097]|uniref:hypothetical protein n=1 Tax=Streptomyces sp. NPDC088097 TaxID=3365823 RepID=UPI0037F14C20